MTPEEMYQDNERLVWYVLNRWFGDRAGDEDVQQEARVGLWKACVMYDKELNFKFSTYAVKAIYTTVVLWLRKTKREIPDYMLVSLEESIKTENGEGMSLKDAIVGDGDVACDDIKMYFPDISERDEKILLGRMDGKSWNAIGREVGVSGTWAKYRVEVLKRQYEKHNM